jgi:hypothetical protein
MNETHRTTFLSAVIAGICSWRRQRAARGFPLVILLFISAAASFPQSQLHSNTNLAATPIIPAQKLDFSRGRLPSNFVPIDPEELYSAVTRVLIPPEKSEFETTAQYQARTEALTQKVLLRGLKASDSFAFVLRPSSRSISGSLPRQHDFLTNGFVETRYDADSKQMSVSIPADEGQFRLDMRSVTAIHRSVNYGAPYVGQNAFGVRRPVQVVKVDTLELDWTDWLPGLALTVEPEEARALTQDIEVIMIGKLRAPFGSHWSDGTQPSLDQIEPTDIRRIHRILYMSLDRLVIANGRTGAILKQWSFQEQYSNN